MAVLPKKMYQMTTSGGTVKVELPTFYDDINSFIGLTVATDASTAIEISSTELVKRGLAIKIRTTRRATAGGVSKTQQVLCDIDTAAAAIGNLKGKVFRGLPITSTGFSRKRSRS